MKLNLLRSAMLFVLFFACILRIASAEEPLRTATDRPVDVHHIALDLDVGLLEKRVTGTATIEFSPLRKLQVLSLDAVDHEVRSVRAGQIDAESVEKIPYDYDGEKLHVEFPESIDRDEKWRLVIDYQIRNPKTGLHFFQPSEAEPNVPVMVWSQGEPVANRYWFPCLDHPNERQTTEMIVTVPKGFEALSNGRLISRESVAEDQKVRFHWKQSKPHVSYLVTLVVGKYRVFREEWRDRPVLYYVEPHRADDAETTFGRTVEMLDFFSDRFGIEYPWAKYAQVVVEQFTAGGMENTSATTLYQGVMHDRRALLDSTPDRLIAHELGHQWWGDLVTCKDWSHLWLNEGFATYCEVLWYEHKLGREERDYLLYQKSKSARTGTPLQRPIVDRRYPSPGSMFDARAYPKGGWVLHMLRTRLGDEEFFGSLQRYGTVYAFQTVETGNFRHILEEMTGHSLERFFYDWTERAGHPVLQIKTDYDPTERLAKIEIKQTQKGEPFELPLTIEFQQTDASPVTLRKLITEKEQTLYFTMPSRPRLVRVDPEYTLLAEIQEQKSRSQWQTQLLEAPTVAERLRAIEHFAKSKQSADVELLIKALNEDPFYGVRAEAAEALGDSGGETALDALIAALKQPHPKVRRAVIEAMAEFVDNEQAAQALAHKNEQGDESYFVEAAVIEALAKVHRKPGVEPFLAALERDSHRDVIRQAALDGLSRCDDERALETLIEWSGKGHPRNCRQAAIGSLADWINRHDVSTTRTNQIVELLVGYLEGEVPRIRRSAVSALRDLGEASHPSLSVIEALAKHDPDRRVRAAANDAVEKLQSDAPPSAELTRLREEVETLRERNRELADRLLKLEAK